MAEREARMSCLIDVLKEVVETGILPDGDHINVPTQMWLEDLYQQIKKLVEENEQFKSDHKQILQHCFTVGEMEKVFQEVLERFREDKIKLL